MPGISMFEFAALRPTSKAMCTIFLLAFIIADLDADYGRWFRTNSSTWYDGYIECQRNGMTMVNHKDVSIFRMAFLDTTIPIWVNGFEVRVNYLDGYFVFKQYRNGDRHRVRCMNSSAFVGNITRMEFEKGRVYCQNQTHGSHIDLPYVNHTNMYMFSAFTDMPYWLKDVDVASILNSEDLTVHCFVLNQSGSLQKEKCSKKYLSICMGGKRNYAIKYTGHDSWVKNYNPTSSSRPVTSPAPTSEFVTSHLTSETYIGVDVTTSTANIPFYLNVSTSDHKTEEEPKTSSISKWISTTLGSCLVVFIVIISCLCLKRKQGNNARTTFQQNELVQQSNVPQGHDDNIDYDVIPDDITEREATPYTSLQMTEKHLFTALVGPSFMSTETSSVIGRIADRDVHVETQFEMSEQQENNNDEPENDDPVDTHYDDVEVSEEDIPGQTNTESEATMSRVYGRVRETSSSDSSVVVSSLLGTGVKKIETASK